MKVLGILRDNVVIYDHPTRIILPVIRNTQHLSALNHRIAIGRL